MRSRRSRVRGIGAACALAMLLGGVAIAATATPAIAVTERVSLTVDGGQRTLASSRPVLSADARFVAFEGKDSGLGVNAVYVHDRQTGVTELVSTFPDGIVRESQAPSMTADGRFVAFSAREGCFGCAGSRSDVYVLDRQTRTMEHVNVFEDGKRREAGESVISGDGRFVAFAVASGRFVVNQGLVPDQLFVHDRQTQTKQQLDFVGSAYRLASSHDGRVLAFESLPPIACHCDPAVSLYDRETNSPEAVSIGRAPSISRDGRFMVMTFQSSRFGEGPDVILYDRVTKVKTSISHAPTTHTRAGFSGVISGDGRFIAWVKDRQSGEGIVVTDRALGRETTVGLPCGPLGFFEDGCATELALSEEGRFMALASTESGLVPGDTNGVSDVFVHSSAPTAFVAGLYDAALGRTADPAGLSGWVDALDADCSPAGLTSVGTGFFDSAEFRARPLTIPDLVTALHRGFLDRDPKPEEQTSWTAVFRGQRVALGVGGFVDSAEFEALVPDRRAPDAVRVVITRFYVEMLGRAPDPEGLAGWSAYVETSGSFEPAAAGFLASPEFERRPLTSRQFIAILYRSIIGRGPDPGGLDAWDRVLRGELTELIAERLLASEEFRGRAAAICGGV